MSGVWYWLFVTVLSKLIFFIHTHGTNQYTEFGDNFYQVPVDEHLLSPPECSCQCNYGKQKACTWAMVFKAVKGNGRNVSTDFLNGGNINMDVTGANRIANSNPYRNSAILDSWNRRDVQMVKIEVYDDSGRKVWFLFDGIDSTRSSWMTKERLLASSYSAINTLDFTYFSIDGNSTTRRRFFIQEDYLGCDGDECGFLVVVDPLDGGNRSSWEDLEDTPYFIFGKKTDVCAPFSSVDVGIGNRFVIKVKYCKKI